MQRRGSAPILLEQTYPNVSSQVNFLNLPNWEIINSQEDDERYVVIARPLTGYTACPACGGTAFVKNRKDVPTLYHLPAHGQHVPIPVQRQRYFCPHRSASYSRPFPHLNERPENNLRLRGY